MTKPETAFWTIPQRSRKGLDESTCMVASLEVYLSPVPELISRVWIVSHPSTHNAAVVDVYTLTPTARSLPAG